LIPLVGYTLSTLPFITGLPGFMFPSALIIVKANGSQ
jgi:hypothetical protein